MSTFTTQHVLFSSFILEDPEVLLEIETVGSPVWVTTSVVNGLSTVVDKEPGVTGLTVLGPGGLVGKSLTITVSQFFDFRLSADQHPVLATLFQAGDQISSITVFTWFFSFAESFGRLDLNRFIGSITLFDSCFRNQNFLTGSSNIWSSSSYSNYLRKGYVSKPMWAKKVIQQLKIRLV